MGSANYPPVPTLYTILHTRHAKPVSTQVLAWIANDAPAHRVQTTKNRPGPVFYLRGNWGLSPLGGFARQRARPGVRLGAKRF